MLTRKERGVLVEAVTIIVRELREQGEIGLRGLGKFYVSEAPCREGMGSSRATHKVATVRFRPWDGVKEQVREALGQVYPIAIVQTIGPAQPEMIPTKNARVEANIYYEDHSLAATPVEVPSKGNGSGHDTVIVCEGCGTEFHEVVSECNVCGLPLEI